MDKSREKAKTKGEESRSTDKRQAEDEVKAVNPKKKHKSEKSKKKDSMSSHSVPIEVELSSIKADIGFLKADVGFLKVNADSIKEDVESIKTRVNSLHSSVDLLPTKDDLLAIFPSSKTPSTKEPWSPSSSDDSSTDEYYLQDALFASGLAPKIDKLAVEEFFKTVGTVAAVEFGKDETGKFDKTAVIRFASAEEAKEALKLIGNNCGGYPMYLRRASNDLYTTYVSGFDKTLPGQEIKLQLIEHFSSIGDVKGIYLTKDEAGGLSGSGYINMVADSAKVVVLNRSLMNGRKLHVETTTQAGKVEMRKSKVDLSMIPKSKKIVFNDSDDE